MSINTTAIDPTLAAKHRAIWASGDYPAIVANVVAPLGPVLVDATGIGPGDRVLDVAAGTGNVAIPAAQTGASVVASDLTPELLATGERIAAERGVVLEWREANAERLPFEDDEFDVVTSAIGVMFAPHHRAAADELLRVCKPGGRIGLINWTPEGLVGQMFSAMKPFVPPPPPGVQPPPLWGSEAHIGSLFGGRIDELVTRRKTLTVNRFETGAAFRDYFKHNYGPTIAAYRNISEDPDRTAALDDALTGLGERFLMGSSVMHWEYLLVTARKLGGERAG
ncbi:methyltransferase domain-containing protein [Mycolicibacterium novocastrense]|nr:methyltransferase domain-containing protein [Mycolicibacterium novocastrense]